MIPDLASVESGVLVSGIGLPIADISVSVHLLHPYVSDLTLDLVGPDGTVVNLSSRNGSSGDNFGTSCAGRTVFTDSSTNRLIFGAAPFIGFVRPDQPLSSFVGKVGAQINGLWRLRITDVAEPDSGSLVCWTLTVSPAQCQDAGGPCFQPPLITSQPESLSVSEGTSATFRATAIGSSPLAYQWFLDETNRVLGATSSVLTIASASRLTAGYYSLIVTNRYGSITSSPALLAVSSRPSILTQPSDLFAIVGSGASLSVAAEGPAPISYQWFRLPATLISGATQPILPLNPAAAEDSGDYRVVVT
ncbi:MAG: immunoglobulin domain-containing protein, partial [Verrucomicrobiales bacterium]